MSIHTRQLQAFLVNNGYTLVVDNKLGPSTYFAMKAYQQVHNPELGPAMDRQTMLVYITQAYLKSLGFYETVVDGKFGPDTAAAIERWQYSMTDSNVAITHDTTHKRVLRWPLQSNVATRFGPIATIPSKLETFSIPYSMKLAWDMTTTVSRITMHHMVKDSVLAVMEQVKKDYDITARDMLGISLYGGAYANRRMRGGKHLSMHAYGIAIDIDPSHNRYHDGPDKARFALHAKDYEQWFAAWASEGWLSLGKARGYDYMHYQAALLD